MRLFSLTRYGLVTLLLTAGLALASAEELVGTPVPLGDDTVISTEITSAPAADIPQMHEPVPPMPPHGAPHEFDWKHELEKGFTGKNSDVAPEENTVDWSFLIPLFAIIFIFGGPIFLVAYLGALHYRSKSQRRHDINTNIDKLLAAGRDIPLELLRGDEARRAEDIGNRDKGVRNLFLGIGWLIFLTIFFGIDIGSIGFIWIALGLSQLVIWKLNNPAGNTQSSTQVGGQQD